MKLNWESAQKLIQPGDILLYRPTAGIGDLLSWGEWTGKDREALEYCHAGIVLTAVQGYEQNPPATHYVDLSKEPWDRIDIWRIRSEYTVDPAKLLAYAAANMNIKYPYLKIGQFFQATLLARIGLVKAARWVNGLWAHDDPHGYVCSATACACLSYAASGNKAIWPCPIADMRPADIPLGQVFPVA